jgi:hypothetical protein
MSIAPGDAALQADDEQPVPAPPSHPRLPIVEFHPDETRPLEVHYAALAALKAAQDRPEDDFFDLRGKVLTLERQDDGTPLLVAGKEGNEAELQRRILAALRRCAELDAGGGRIPKDVQQMLAWLAGAPSVAFLVHALGLAYIDDLHAVHKNCRRCTRPQMWAWGTPTCCPG